MMKGFTIERYPNLRKWLKEASRDPELRMICINILSEFFFGNIPQDELEKAFFRLDDHIKERKNRYFHIDEIVRLAWHLLWRKRRKKGHYLKDQIKDFNENEFTRKGQPTKIESDEVFSRVLLLNKIRAYCVAPGYDWDISIEIDSPESIQYLETLIESHNEQNTVLVNFTGKKGIFWFTKAEQLRSIKQDNKAGNIASSVRNALGLCGECGVLIEIQFQSDYIENGKKPTIFDSDFLNPFFRPKSRKSNWGFALDSENLIESLPEAIHEKKGIWPKIYKWEILGTPDLPKFPPEEKWKELRKNSLCILSIDCGVDKNSICEYIFTDKEDWI